MGSLKGMIVKLDTKNISWAGTDDHLWIGVFGKGGGREFCLDVRHFDDFEPDAYVKYWFGNVWDGAELSGARKPWQSQATENWNNPSVDDVDLDAVEYVYLRKSGTRRSDRDDAYVMDDVTVILYGTSPQKRVFQRTKDIRLSNESGLQVWLPEIK